MANKLQLLLALLIFDLIFACYGITPEQQINYKGLRPVYKRISRHLVSHVGSEDPFANIQEATRWMNDVRADESLYKGLKVFTALGDTVGENKCSSETVEIIEANDYITSYKARNLDENNELDRVELVIRYYAMKHAQECRDVYTQNLKYRNKKMFKVVKESVQTFADKMRTEVENNLVMTTKTHGKVVFETVQQLANKARDPDRSYLRTVMAHNQPDQGLWSSTRVVHEPKVRGLFNKYLVGPCKIFMTLNYDGMLEAAEYDDEWVPRSDEFGSLYDSVVYRYKTCKRLVENDQDTLLKMLFVKVAED